MVQNACNRTKGPEFMKQLRIVLTLAIALAAIFWINAASAQVALPTASRALQLSAFGGLTGVYTGLSHGKNLSITAGGDLGLPPWRGIRPSIEVRGTYPVHGGRVDSEKSILAGAKVEFLLNHRLHPYGDFLLGRGQIDYKSSGYVFNNQVFLLTTTNVYSPGAGVDFDLTNNLAVKVDAQFQHWGYTPTPSGSIYSKVGTIAIIYRFNFDRRHRH
jgi:opacity protein-like surface antigen